jgi:RHS repeat-associated protein
MKIACHEDSVRRIDIPLRRGCHLPMRRRPCVRFPGAGCLSTDSGKLLPPPRSTAYAFNQRPAMDDPGAGTVALTFDGWSLIEERDGAGLLQAEYVHGPMIDEVLARIGPGGATVYYHADALGSVTHLTDGSGTVVESYAYDAFGKPHLATPPASGNRFLFQGREWLHEIGLADHRNRLYSPELQRWLNRDPIGEAGGMNLYAFVGNDPANFIDPDGEKRFRDYLNALICAVGLICGDEHKAPRNPTSARQEQQMKWEEEKRAEAGRRKRGGAGHGLKCIGPLGLLLGIGDDIDRFMRAMESDRSFQEQLEDDLRNYPVIDFGYGPIPNPYYRPAIRI